MLQLQVTRFWNNGYSGGLDITATYKGVTETFELGGSGDDIGRQCFSLTDWDGITEELNGYDDAEERGFIDSYGCMTKEGEAYMTPIHLDMLNDHLSDVEEGPIYEHILQQMKVLAVAQVINETCPDEEDFLYETEEDETYPTAEGQTFIDFMKKLLEVEVLTWDDVKADIDLPRAVEQAMEEALENVF